MFYLGSGAFASMVMAADKLPYMKKVNDKKIMNAFFHKNSTNANIFYG